MKIDNVYIGDILRVYKTECTGNSFFDMENHYKTVYARTTLVYEKQKGGHAVFVDLRTKKVYSQRSYFIEVGDEIVDCRTLIPAREFEENPNKIHSFRKTLIKKLSPYIDKNKNNN